MKGSYILFIKLNNNQNIKYGKKEKFNFKKGYYIYIGSALNS
jgi:Uri superfamily endonuclease